MFQKLLTLPGMLQFRRSWCCLACGLKDGGFDDKLLQVMVAGEFRVSAIYVGATEEIEAVMEPLSKEKRRAIVAIARSLVDVHGVAEPPLIHPMYYRINELEVRYETTFGKIKRGEILEIFQHGDEETGISEDILFFLRRDFVDMKKRSHLYPDLASEPFESCVTISINQELSSIYFTTPREGKTRFMVPSIPIDLQVLSCEMFLRGCERVSLILVRDILGDAENAPAIRDWIGIFQRVFGDLDNMIVVFMIKYDEFLKFGVNSKSAVRRMVNRNLSPNLLSTIKVVDVSSASDTIKEEGPMKNLSVSALIN